MSNETNQDPQKPTEDQPPPKQYATPRPGESGERGTDERKPRIPDRVESSEGDDEDRRAAEQRPGYDEDASVRGTTGAGGSDKRPNTPNQGGAGAGASKPGDDGGQKSGGGSRQTPGSGVSGSSSGSGNPGGGRSGK